MKVPIPFLVPYLIRAGNLHSIFPLQGTPLIFQKQEQQVEVLHLKIANTILYGKLPNKKATNMFILQERIPSVRSSSSLLVLPSDRIHIMFDFKFELQRHQGENNTHIHSSWMRDIFPTKCTKSSSCNPFNWPSWISWWRCSWYTGVSAVFSLWSPFFAYFRPMDFGFWAQFCSHLSFDIMHTPRSSQSWSPNTSPPHVQQGSGWHIQVDMYRCEYIIYKNIYYILNQHFIIQKSHISYYFTRYVQEGYPMVNAHQTCWLLW